MRIFVTVGTGRFDKLIKEMDKTSPHEVLMQIGYSSYLPVHAKYFRFRKRLSSYYSWADLIVSHAGAGTVFELMNGKRRFIVVPNLDRTDSHQLDLAVRLSEEGYFPICKKSIWPLIGDSGWRNREYAAPGQEIASVIMEKVR